MVFINYVVVYKNRVTVYINRVAVYTNNRLVDPYRKDKYFFLSCQTFLRFSLPACNFFVSLPTFLDIKHFLMNQNECVNLLQSSSDVLRKEYGIISLRLFGSMARGEQTDSSDVDIFVDTQTPNPFVLMNAKDYLTKIMKRPVDIIRNHKNLNPRLRRRIERDGILVF